MIKVVIHLLGTIRTLSCDLIGMFCSHSNIVSVITAKYSEILLHKITTTLTKLATVHLVNEAKAIGKIAIF